MEDLRTPYELLFDFIQHIKREWMVIAEERGMSLAQLHALWLLMNGPAPMVQLSTSMLCDASYVTGIVDRLEQQGMVERREDPSDRRVKLIALTSKGRELRGDIEKCVQALQAKMFENLSAQEQAELSRLLRKVSKQAVAHS